MAQSRLGLASALAWLNTRAGAELLAEAALLPPDRLTRLTRLRRRVPAEIASAAVELLELRRRARAKFARAEAMWFTVEGLEQSTGEAIARYRASRFPPLDAVILDACCGIGGDALALAERGPVFAVDQAPAAAFCARANAALHRTEASFPVHTLCADVTRLDLKRLREAGVNAAFFDPSRRLDDRAGNRRRAVQAEDYSPPLSWLETLRAEIPALAVKVSPALNDAALERTGGSVEFVSDRGECKEAILWFGPLARRWHTPSAACATVLRPGEPPQTLSPFRCKPLPPSAPRAWLYEPDPAVIRAHLIPQLSHHLSAPSLDSQIAYLTSDQCTPTPFASAYRILDTLSYNLKHIQARLRALNARLVAIKKRGVPFEPEDLRKKLTDAGDTPLVLVLTRREEKPIALLCEPVKPELDGASERVSG